MLRIRRERDSELVSEPSGRNRSRPGRERTVIALRGSVASDGPRRVVPSRSRDPFWERAVLVKRMRTNDIRMFDSEVDAVSPANRGTRVVVLSLLNLSLLVLLLGGLLISGLQT